MSPGHDEDIERRTPDPLLGSGHGIDHFIVVAESLPEASRDFREKLGFDVRHGGRHPSGTENAVILFQDREYLELLALSDQPGAQPEAADVRSFLSRGEGAMAVGIQVASAEATSTHLTEKGIHHEGPTPGTIAYPGIDEPPPTFWTSLTLKTGRKFVDDTLFFIEYVQGAYREFRGRHPELPPPGSAPPRHPNSAFGILHPWLAVAKAGEVKQVYEEVGFPVVRRARLGTLKGSALELRAGQSSLLLVESTAPEGPIREFLKRRDADYGWMGVSLGVDSLKTALGAMQRSLADRLEPATGLFGKSVLVPPEFAHGIWLELFERGRFGE